MTLYVYADGARVGLVEDIRSLQWLSEFQDAGEVKLVCSATDKNKALLADGRRLYCTDQPESALIRRTELADDGKDATLTVRAVLSAARWADRVVMATRQITLVETGMLELAEANRRGLPGVTAPARGIPDKTDTQISWGSVLDAEITLAKAAGLGFREIFDPATAQETFEVYQGTDRTQGEGYNGWFGDDIGNLASYTLAQGTDGWKNLAIVAGEGEGADRTVVTASLETIPATTGGSCGWTPRTSPAAARWRFPTAPAATPTPKKPIPNPNTRRCCRPGGWKSWPNACRRWRWTPAWTKERWSMDGTTGWGIWYPSSSPAAGCG